MAQAGGMLGGAAMQAAGYQTPAQIKQQARNEVKAMFPNPQTRSEMIAMANAFKNLNQMDDYEKIMKLADDMTGGTDMKKWSFEQQQKRDAIRREAERRGFTLSQTDIDDIAITTPLTQKLHPTTGKPVHPWMDQLEWKLSTMKKGESTQKEPTPSVLSTETSKEVGEIEDTKALQSMNTSFRTEVKGAEENLRTVSSGLENVRLIREENIAATPQLERMLAKFNSDNRISVPEVKQVMKMGGLGDRITDAITRFLGGDLSPGTLNDIEEMLIRTGQLEQDRYNAKISEYKLKYGSRFDKEQLDNWLKPKTFNYLTNAQKQELVLQEIKKRGL